MRLGIAIGIKKVEMRRFVIEFPVQIVTRKAQVKLHPLR